MKKFLSGVLALALVFTLAVPVLAAENVSSVDTSTANTSTVTNLYVASKADYDQVFGAGAYDKLIASNTTKVANVVKEKAADIKNFLENAKIDTSKKTIAKTATKVFDLEGPGLVAGDVTTEWKIEKGSFSDASLGDGQYVVVHVKDDGTAEYQIVTTKNGVVQEELVFHGASPVAFYAVVDNTEAKAKSPKTGDASMALIILAIAGAGVVVASKKKIA
ncbi:MAG: NPXTG-anchored protein [Lachnospiraceae bacterium]|nr:NPXTG-anchored protein [Lachnospiraceae bacterium]